MHGFKNAIIANVLQNQYKVILFNTINGSWKSLTKFNE